MRLLFAISVASFCTVLWIALSLARRLERARLARRRPSARGPATEFFEAGEYRTPRPMPNQQVASLRARPRVSEPAGREVSTAESAAYATEPGPVRHLWPSPPRATQDAAYNGITGESRRIIDSTIQLVATEPARQVPYSSSIPGPALVTPPERPIRDLSGERKSPQSARSGTFRRVDLSHYNNEDMGDLTDPYTHIVRPSGTRRAVKNS